MKIKGVVRRRISSGMIEMPNETSLRGAEKNVQDWISLVCGVLLFVSPRALAAVQLAVAACQVPETVADWA
jgi:hypothetical protein